MNAKNRASQSNQADWLLFRVPADPLARIELSADELDIFINRLAVKHQLGRLHSFDINPHGYEDCNVLITTDLGNYFVKALNRQRSAAQVHRYSEVLSAVANSAVRHPRLFRHQDEVLFTDKKFNLHYFLMEDADAEPLFDRKDSKPTDDELIRTVGQAALVNSMDVRPSLFIEDLWAVPNIDSMHQLVAQFIPARCTNDVDRIVKAVLSIPFADLPRAFVHGDFTKSNVLISDKGIPNIIDFSVANWTPRVQELGVIASNFAASPSTSLTEQVEATIDAYENYAPLHQIEKDVLPIYAIGGIGQEYLGSLMMHHLKHHEDEEATYWMERGPDLIAAGIEKVGI